MLREGIFVLDIMKGNWYTIVVIIQQMEDEDERSGDVPRAACIL